MVKTQFLILTFSFVVGQIAAQTPPQYAEQILNLSLPVGTLEGSLVVPNGVEKPDLVFIIAGSGPTDRNCNSGSGLKTDAFKMLADSLARLGIASFRYDKRGIGASKINQKQSDLVFEDFVKDAILWLDTLKSLNRFATITIVGHSEGSLIGSIAAQKTASADQLISLCGVPLAMDSMIYVQLGKQAPSFVPPLRAIYNRWKRGETADSIPPHLNSVAHPSLKNFMGSIMQYTPSDELAKLQKPVLFIGGKNDIQVFPDLFENLAKAQPKARLIMFPKMTHILKDGTTNPLETYALMSKINVPITEGVADAIADFIKKK